MWVVLLNVSFVFGAGGSGGNHPTTKTKKDLMPPGNLEATPKSFPKEGTRSRPRNLNGA